MVSSVSGKRETTEIPQEIYDSIIEELKKGRMEISSLNSKAS